MANKKLTNFDSIEDLETAQKMGAIFPMATDADNYKISAEAMQKAIDEAKSTPPIPEEDGKLYGIKDKRWTEFSYDSVPEAPIDGRLYGRMNSHWIEIINSVSGRAPIEVTDNLATNIGSSINIVYDDYFNLQVGDLVYNTSSKILAQVSLLNEHYRVATVTTIAISGEDTSGDYIYANGMNKTSMSLSDTIGETATIDMNGAAWKIGELIRDQNNRLGVITETSMIGTASVRTISVPGIAPTTYNNNTHQNTVEIFGDGTLEYRGDTPTAEEYESASRIAFGSSKTLANWFFTIFSRINGLISTTQTGNLYPRFVVALGDDANQPKPDWANYYSVGDGTNYVIPFSAWGGANTILLRRHPTANFNGANVVLEVDDDQYRTIYLAPYSMNDDGGSLNGKAYNIRRTGDTGNGASLGITVTNNNSSMVFIFGHKAQGLTPTMGIANF